MSPLETISHADTSFMVIAFQIAREDTISRMFTFLVIMCVFHTGQPLSVEDVKRFPIEMPGAAVERPETYLCTTVRLDTNTTHWLTGYEPGAEQRTAHHMILYGCREPGRREKLFR